MRILDYLYFNLYTFYYKSGDCKPTDNPSLRAAHILSFTCLIWIVMAIVICTKFILNEKTLPDIWIWAAIYIAFFIPINYLYCTKKRDEHVYEIYKKASAKRKRIGIITTLSLLIMPLLLVFLFAFV